MPFTLRKNLGRPLSFDELDGNFQEVETMVSGANSAIASATSSASAAQISAGSAESSAAQAALSSQQAVTAASAAQAQAESAIQAAEAADEKASIPITPGDAEKGAGGVPYDNSLEYPSGSTGAALKASESAAQVLRQDLANSAPSESGASLVGYRGRTVDDRLSDIVSLRNYGVVGDGATDNLAAVQNAIADAAGRIICVPVGPEGGNYAITSGTLNIPNGQRFLYEGDARIYAVSPGTISDAGNHLSLLGQTSSADLTRGLSINIRETVSGSGSVSTYKLNSIIINNDQVDAQNDGTAGTKVDGLFIQHRFGGSAARGGRHASEALLVQSASTASDNVDRNYVGAVGMALSSTGDGGTDLLAGARGAYFGMNPVATLQAGATNTFNVSAMEANVNLLTGSSTRYRSGVQIVGGGDVVGSQTDAAVSISNKGGSTAKWGHGLLFGAQNGGTCFNSSSRVLTVGAETVDRVINLESLVSANFLFYGPAGGVTLTNTVLGLNNAAARLNLGSTSAASSTTINFRTSGNANDYDARITGSAGNATTGNGSLQVSAAELSVGCVIRPAIDDTYALGRSDRRFTQLFAVTGTINTSDEREKEQVRELSERERNAALELKGKLRAFKWKDAVAEKGDAARWHFGVMAQEVQRVFERHGLDAHEYAMFCHDEWEAAPEVLGDDGEVVAPEIVAGERYGVRYDQLLAFIISAI